MTYEITQLNEPARHLAVTRFTTTVDGIGEKVSAAFATVFGYLGAHGLEPLGPPVTHYVMGEDAFEVRVGCEVRDLIEADGTMEPFELPATTTLSTVHVGPYDDLPKAYEALQTRASELGLQLDPVAMWEEYLTGPEVPPDQIRTQVHWPVVG